MVTQVGHQGAVTFNMLYVKNTGRKINNKWKVSKAAQDRHNEKYGDNELQWNKKIKFWTFRHRDFRH